VDYLQRREKINVDYFLLITKESVTEKDRVAKSSSVYFVSKGLAKKPALASSHSI
jgi:hypothetical protein